jgi:4-hydroxy-3-methylbut-2-enyl diphosphate reductase
MTHCEGFQVHLSFPQGPCFGVKRSIDICRKLLHDEGLVYAIHPLVHNEVVMHDLMKNGLILEENIENIPDKSTVILSAHGTPKEGLQRLKEKQCKVVDAVCPLVLFVHKKALESVQQRGKVNVVGDPNHQEVKALLSDLPQDSYILAGETGELAEKYYPVVFQSTTDPCILDELKSSGFDVVDTICFATKGRQQAIKDLINRCDALLVLGSSTSANSKHLADKAINAGKPVLLTLDLSQVGCFAINYKTVGIIAGASTPLEVVFDAYDRIINAYEEVCNHRSP